MVTPQPDPWSDILNMLVDGSFAPDPSTDPTRKSDANPASPPEAPNTTQMYTMASTHTHKTVLLPEPQPPPVPGRRP